MGWCVLICGATSDQAANFLPTDVLRIQFVETNREQGLHYITWPRDSIVTNAWIDEQPAKAARPLLGQRESYLYFSVEPAWKGNGLSNVQVMVSYYDSRPGQFDIQYDSYDPRGTMRGIYNPTKTRVILSGARAWKAAAFTLRHVRFENLQNGSADFRLRILGPELYVSQLIMRAAPNVTNAVQYSASTSFSLGETNTEQSLLQPVSHEDGMATAAAIDGQDCLRFGRSPNIYLYFQVAPEFIPRRPCKAKIAIEYFDAETGYFDIQYDSWLAPYLSHEDFVLLEGTRKWATAEFVIDNARFEHRQNGGADFRISPHTRALYVRQVTLYRE